ncbi:MAG: UDP-N-acetylmuramoyl-L-alanyl-D-glutamate--2,6-diaminopimelate ligase [Candidatus Goldiibacteriota bacterium]
MKIKDILEGIRYKVEQGTDEAFVSGIEESSEQIKKGSAFFCIRGFKTDGHIFAAEAARKKAGAVIVEKKTAVRDKNINIIRVANTKKALLKAVEKIYADDRRKVSVIGITGTNGKTTVSYIADAMIKSKTHGENTVIGTVGYKIGNKKYPAATTTPSNLVVNKIIRRSAEKKIKNIIMEVSSHALSQGRVENIKFDAAVITNITRDHIDYHRTRNNYIRSKLKIISKIKDGGILVLNRDDSSFVPAMKEAEKKGVKVITFSFGKKADIRVLKHKSGLNGSEFILETEGKQYPFKTRLIGEHNISNIMAAAGVVCDKVNIKDMQKAVKKFEAVKGRMETIETEKCRVIVDFAHTPDSMKKVLQKLRALGSGKIITVFGAGGNRDKGKRMIMGKIAGDFSDRIIVTSDNPRDEKPENIIKDIVSGIKQKEKFKIESNRRKAIRLGVKNAGEKDIVVILGKGHETYQEIKGKRYPFDDIFEAEKAVKDRRTRLIDILGNENSYKVIQGSDMAEISSIEEFSGGAKKGSVFVCVKGIKTNGHKYIREAFENGACAAVVQEKVKAPKGMTVIQVSDTKKAFSGMIDIYYKEVLEKIKIIGVTGTNGKTTVSSLIAFLIKEKTKKNPAFIGTINYSDGRKNYKAVNTTPSKLQICRIAEKALRAGVKYLVMEVSSHALDQGRVENLKFDTAVITNITREHLDYHADIGKYINVKMSIAEAVEPGGRLVLNADDKNSAGKFSKIRSADIEIVRYGIKSRKNDIKAAECRVCGQGSEFMILSGKRKIKIKTQLIGEHNIYNILAAAGALEGFMDLKEIKTALMKFQGVKGRMEKVYSGDMKVFMDFAHTPDGLEKVLQTLNQIKENNITLVLGVSGNRDKGKRPIMGRIAEKLADRIILTTDNPRFEEPSAIIKGILSGMKHPEKAEIEYDRKKAVEKGIVTADKGGIVLITGKGHSNYQEIKGKYVRLDERPVIMRTIQRINSGKNKRTGKGKSGAYC